MSNITLKKIVGITLELIILDLLLPKANFILGIKKYPTFKRLRHISKKIVGYR